MNPAKWLIRIYDWARTHQTMINSSRWKRIAIIATGWLFIALGVIGLILPILQGILFLLIGVAILATEYPWAKRLLGKIRARFPRLDSSIKAARERAAVLIGTREK